MSSSFVSKYLKSSKRPLSLLDQQQWLTMALIKQIQAHLTVSGTLSDPFASGKIITFCVVSDRGDLPHAYRLFRRLPHHTTFIWNTIIRAFVETNQPALARSLYREMLGTSFLPNNYTFSFILRACVDLSDFLLGLITHAKIVKLGWEAYDYVQNGLIHLYASCSSMATAERLFEASSNRDVITWTALLNGYVKAGSLEDARRLFDEMPERNSVSWSAMINGYVQVGLFKEALGLFNDMQVAGVQPNQAGIVGALTACAFLGALDQGKWIHAYLDRNGMKMDGVLYTALVDMYAKCGCIETAFKVFDEMPVRDVFAFTSLISGLANHGLSEPAMEVFFRMKNERVSPNRVTFICVLNACSRMGLVEEGLRVFESMRGTYGVEPGVEHYGCLVDLLGRAGMLEEAKDVVKKMPMQPDSYVLGALLNSCRVHGDVELGKEMVGHLMARSLDHSGVHVLLSNMYASVNRWDAVTKKRTEMEEKNVKKTPGCSLVQVDGLVCEFVAGDRSHMLMDGVLLSSLFGIDKNMRSLGLDEDDIII